MNENNEITDAELDAIEARADAATPEPWKVMACDWAEAEPGWSCSVNKVDAKDYYDDAIFKSDSRDECSHIVRTVDAEHIAGMDPPTTKRLVTALRAARKRIAELEKR